MTVGTSNVVIFCICLLVVVAVVALIVNKTFFKQLVIKFRGRTEEIISTMQLEKKKLYTAMQNGHIQKLPGSWMKQRKSSTT